MKRNDMTIVIFLCIGMYFDNHKKSQNEQFSFFRNNYFDKPIYCVIHIILTFFPLEEIFSKIEKEMKKLTPHLEVMND